VTIEEAEAALVETDLAIEVEVVTIEEVEAALVEVIEMVEETVKEV